MKKHGIPHHIIQRGVDGQTLFFSDEDYAVYRELLALSCTQQGVSIWGYCLMPDHIHLIAVPERDATLKHAIHTANTRYAKNLTSRKAPVIPAFNENPAHHLLDEEYLIKCARYIEINPVKRDYVTTAEAWPWSSTTAHIEGKDDTLVTVAPLLSRVPENWSKFLATPIPSQEADLFYAHELSGKPMGKG